MPSPIDCINTAPPRKTGSFKIGNLSLHFGRLAAVLTIVPSALRTAIAYALGVRIMTPSITAWPPTIRSRSLVLMLKLLFPPPWEMVREHYLQQCRRLFRLLRLDAIRSAGANYAGTFCSFAANDEIASSTHLLAGAGAVLP